MRDLSRMYLSQHHLFLVWKSHTAQPSSTVEHYTDESSLLKCTFPENEDSQRDLRAADAEKKRKLCSLARKIWIYFVLRKAQKLSYCYYASEASCNREPQYSVILAVNYTKSNYNLSQGLFCLHTSHLETKLQVILIQMYICQIQENLGSVSCMHLL